METLMLAFLTVTGLFSLALALALKGVDGLGFALGAALAAGLIVASGSLGKEEVWAWAVALAPSLAVALAKVLWENRGCLPQRRNPGKGGSSA